LVWRLFAGLACLAPGILCGQSNDATTNRDKVAQITGPSDREIVLTRSFAAPRQRVFDALIKYDFSPLQILVTTELNEVNGRTVLTQRLLYSSNKDRDVDFDAVASSAEEIGKRLEEYLESR
jgi:hypothetical protein